MARYSIYTKVYLVNLRLIDVIGYEVTNQINLYLLRYVEELNKHLSIIKYIMLPLYNYVVFIESSSKHFFC